MTTADTLMWQRVVPAPLRNEVRWLGGMSWERLGWFLATICAFSLLSMHSAVFLEGKGFSSTLGDVALAYSGWVLRYTVMFGPALVAVTIADNIPVEGAKRVAVLAIALLFAAQFQWPIRCLYEPWEESSCQLFPSSLFQSWLEYLAGQTLWTICWTTVIALAYFYPRRDLRVAEALHAAELSRADMQRKTLEAELQTMRARVEPEFLFETLGDIGELFERDPASGERMLDELIGYLRSALPDMRATSSTVKQEIALSRAYLAILQLRKRHGLAVEVNVPVALENVVMPPMLILPLVAAAVDTSNATESDATSIRIEALAEPRGIRIVLIGRGPAVRPIGDAPVVHEMRERLRAVYGDRASLAVDVEGGKRLTAILEIPHETV
jgi:Histidine kinase